MYIERAYNLRYLKKDIIIRNATTPQLGANYAAVRR